MEYPTQGNPYTTLPPSERRDLWGVGTVCVILYDCTLTYPLRFSTWGTREMCFQGRTSKRFYKRNDRSEVRTP